MTEEKFITKKELQERIKELGLNPSDLFEEDALLSEPEVKSLLEEARKEKKKEEAETDLVPGDNPLIPDNEDNENDSLIPD